MIGIYKIVNKISNKIYVGQSVNIERRLSYHKNRLRLNLHFNQILQNSWNKYGEDNFDFEIIEECLIEDLNKRENYWCKFFDVWDRSKGYNLCITTDFKKFTFTDDVKKKIGLRRKGMIHSKETRKLISDAHIGKKFSEETRKKMSDSKKGTKHSEETKRKFSEYRKKNPNKITEKWLESKLKPVTQYNVNGDKIEDFPSATSAYNKTGIPTTCIIACCKGRRKIAKGYKFKYTENETKIKE